MIILQCMISCGVHVEMDQMNHFYELLTKLYKCHCLLNQVEVIYWTHCHSSRAPPWCCAGRLPHVSMSLLHLSVTEHLALSHSFHSLSLLTTSWCLYQTVKWLQLSKSRLTRITRTLTTPRQGQIHKLCNRKFSAAAKILWKTKSPLKHILAPSHTGQDPAALTDLLLSGVKGQVLHWDKRRYWVWKDTNPWSRCAAVTHRISLHVVFWLWDPTLKGISAIDHGRMVLLYSAKQN